MKARQLRDAPQIAKTSDEKQTVGLELCSKRLTTFTTIMLKLGGLVPLGFIIYLLANDLIQPTIAISSIAVPQEFSNTGYTSEVAAQKLQIALNKFDKKANLLLLVGFQPTEDLGSKEIEPVINADRPSITVPGTGLSLETIETYIRAIIPFFPFANHWDVSGAITTEQNKLRLRLRINRQGRYVSEREVDLERRDDLWPGAQKVFELVNPYRVAVYLADKELSKSRELAKIIIDDHLESDDKLIVATHVLIGRILTHINQTDDAINEFRQAIKLDSGSASAHIGLAEALRRQHGTIEDVDPTFNQAITLFRNAIDRNPNSASAHTDLGLALYRHHSAAEVKGAVDEFHKAIKLDPIDAGNHADLGVALYNQDTDGAKAEFDRAIELDPSSVFAHMMLGRVLLSQNKNEAAIAAFQNAVDLEPRNFIVLGAMGDALLALGNPKEAIAKFGKAIEFDPLFALAHLRLGDALRAHDESDKAIAAYSEAIGLAPKYAPAFNKRGEAYSANQYYGHAIADYNEAIRLDPTFPDAFKNRGLAYAARQDYDHAIADYNEAIRLDPKVVYPALWLYIARTRSGAHTAASELETNARNLKQPDWPYPVVELFLGLRTPKSTLAALTKSADRCEAQFYVGEWHLLRGDRSKALAALKAAEGTCPKEKLEYYFAGVELQRLQR